MNDVLVILFSITGILILVFTFLWPNKYNLFLDKLAQPTLKKATLENSIITIEYTDGTFVKYKGGSTVWKRLPKMERPGTHTESLLSQIEEYVEHYGNPYPTAHLETKND